MTEQQKLFGAVASLPCKREEGHPFGDQQTSPTQVAHSNQLRDGKGRGIKAHWWRVAAMCRDCHVEIDSGHRLSKEERREQWDEAHRKTIGALFEQGLLTVREEA